MLAVTDCSQQRLRPVPNLRRSQADIFSHSESNASSDAVTDANTVTNPNCAPDAVAHANTVTDSHAESDPDAHSDA